MKRSIPLVVALMLLMVNLGAAAPDSGQLYFGWAKTSITPDRPVAICGQYHTRISGQVHDPLQATALALETRKDGKTLEQAVWVSCDLVAIRGLVLQRVRERLQGRLARLDPQKVLLSATHTHTAPALTDTDESNLHPYDFMGSWAYRIPDERDDVMRPAAYVEFLVRQLAQVIAEAWESRRPGGLSSGIAHAVIAHNRRAVYTDGSTRMYGGTAEPNFSHIEGISDHSIEALFFWRNTRLEGVAVNVYCPSQEVEGESYLSADFWHDTRKALRKAYGEELHVLPLCGASGDQSPHLMWNKKAERQLLQRNGRSPREEIAHRIALAVKDAMSRTRDSIRTELMFEHRVKRVALPVWKVSDQRFQEAKTLYEAGRGKEEQLPSMSYIEWRVSRTLMARYRHQQANPDYQAELHLLRLGDVAVATNPFELFTDYGVRIKERSPGARTLVVQLTADCAAYLPTRRAVAGGGYSARIVDGVVGPEGGDVLVNSSIESLKAMWSKP